MSKDDLTPTHTAEFEKDGKWIIASCPEFPEANGQGTTQAKAAESLRHAIAALEHDRIYDENVWKRQG
ncbi:MAG: type II toxin-antitoxin system HicB family antitoxin [Akkermansiaceae bacterium]